MLAAEGAGGGERIADHRQALGPADAAQLPIYVAGGPIDLVDGVQVPERDDVPVAVGLDRVEVVGVAAARALRFPAGPDLRERDVVGGRPRPDQGAVGSQLLYFGVQKGSARRAAAFGQVDARALRRSAPSGSRRSAGAGSRDGRRCCRRCRVSAPSVPVERSLFGTAPGVIEPGDVAVREQLGVEGDVRPVGSVPPDRDAVVVEERDVSAKTPGGEAAKARVGVTTYHWASRVPSIAAVKAGKSSGRHRTKYRCRPCPWKTVRVNSWPAWSGTCASRIRSPSAVRRSTPRNRPPSFAETWSGDPSQRTT